MKETGETHKATQAAPTYTLKMMSGEIDLMGSNGGGIIVVTGTKKGKKQSIVVNQTEWHDTPVCLIGGFGHHVRALNTGDDYEKIQEVLKEYFDEDASLTYSEFEGEMVFEDL